MLLLVPLIQAETTFYEGDYFILGEIPPTQANSGVEKVFTTRVICNDISFFLANNNLDIDELNEENINFILNNINKKIYPLMSKIELRDYIDDYDSICIEKKKINLFWIIPLVLLIIIILIILRFRR